MKELKNKIKEQLLNKNRNISILAFSFTILICIQLLSCNPIVKTIGPFSSPSIEESKKRGVFLWEYHPVSTTIHDTINFEIKEVFAEKQYQYYSYKDLRYKISEDKTQIKIVAKRKLSDLYYFELWVVDGFDWYGDCGLVRDYDQGVPPDTLVVKILKVDINEQGLAGREDKKEIGILRLKRK